LTLSYTTCSGFSISTTPATFFDFNFNSYTTFADISFISFFSQPLLLLLQEFGMRQSWKLASLFSGGIAFLSVAFPVLAAPPTASQILSFKPKQGNIIFAIPSAEEEPSCKVELVKGAVKGSGWVLKDAQGNLLRKFFDSNEDNQIDIWSYYKDGIEVYREIDSNFNGKPDIYRWLNSAGTKVGIDENEDAFIDSWQTISPEEVSQEILKAVAAKDFSKLKPLFLTEADLKTLDLQGDALRKVREQILAAPAKFKATLTKLPTLDDKTTWLHVEMATPQCLPADQTGSKNDIFRHSKGTVLYEAAGKTDWLQTGEMFLVNGAWKLADGPIPGAISEDEGSTRPGSNKIDLEKDPELKKLVDDLATIDASAESNITGGASATLAKHHLRRADHLEKILAKVKPEERDPWIRQLADSLSSAAQNSPAADTLAAKRLTSLEDQLAKGLPGSNLAAYVSFRNLQADYASRISKPGEDFNKIQNDWMTRLAAFVQAYPKADDTPDALLQLGMVSEFLGKEVEAKNWYTQIGKNFVGKPQAAKALGSIRRMDSEGQPFTLSGTSLTNPSQTFDIASLKDKMVVVYYWASWNGQTLGDFAKLKLIIENYAAKGIELVCVNLDTTSEEATAFLKRSPITAQHLYQSGGLEGKLAADYGIQVLPQLFLVGKDGKVVGKNLQVSNVEEEIKKNLK